MKAGTIEVVVKGVCYVLIGGLANFGSSLSQWANSGEWPGRINWVVIIGSCVLGAATQLLAYMSGSYSTYKAAPNGNGNGTVVVTATSSVPGVPIK